MQRLINEIRDARIISWINWRKSEVWRNLRIFAIVFGFSKSDIASIWAMFLSLRKRNDESLPLLRTDWNAINGQRNERGIPGKSCLFEQEGFLERFVRLSIQYLAGYLTEKRSMRFLKAIRISNRTFQQQSTQILFLLLLIRCYTNFVFFHE